MLACKGIFATPSIDTVLERAQKSVSSWEFYEIKFYMYQLYHTFLLKAIIYGKLVKGVGVCKFGKQWIVSAEAE